MHDASYPVRDITRKEKILALVATLLGLFLAALDQTIVATAGPAIQRDLAISPSLYTWITTAYLVASTVMVPVYGKLSDQLGRKRVLLIGISIFLSGSLLCGLAPNALMLVLFRALQGIGAAALFTTAFTVLADLFPPKERAKYQGLFTGVFGISSIIGPLAGGIITDRLGWHWVFFVNLPIGVIAIALAAWTMPALKPLHPPKGRVDVPGAALLVFGVTPVMLAMSLGRARLRPDEPGFLWSSPQIIGLFAVAIIALAAFVAVEKRTEEPIVDLRLYANRSFALCSACAFMIGASFLAGPVFLPLYLVNAEGASATRAGMAMLPLTLGVVFGATVGGQLASRRGRYKWMVVGSCAVLTGACLWMGFSLEHGVSQWPLALRMFLLGLGVGPTLPLLTIAIQMSVKQTQMGVATAAVTFARVLGQVLGVALLGSIFAATFHSQVERLRAPQSGASAVVSAPVVAAREAGAPVVSTEVPSASVLARTPGEKRALAHSVGVIYQVAGLVAFVAMVLALLMPDVQIHGPPVAPVLE